MCFAGIWFRAGSGKEFLMGRMASPHDKGRMSSPRDKGRMASPHDKRRLPISPLNFMKTPRHSQCHITHQEQISRTSAGGLFVLGIAIPILRLLSPPSHGIYKWQQERSRQAHPRRVSFSGSTGMTPDPAFEHIHEPGGFRRNYVLLQGASGEESEQPRMLNNFIDFLYLFGHFVSGQLGQFYLCIFLTSVRREKTLRRLKIRMRRLKRRMRSS